VIQVFDNEAGELTARDALGGPQYLGQQNFYFGLNDVVSGDYRTGALFNPTVFKLYDAWNTVVPGYPAVVSTSKKLKITDHGISLDISGKNGFYSGFAYQS
jgi:hypothetical protein